MVGYNSALSKPLSVTDRCKKNSDVTVSCHKTTSVHQDVIGAGLVTASNKTTKTTRPDFDNNTYTIMRKKTNK